MIFWHSGMLFFVEGKAKNLAVVIYSKVFQRSDPQKRACMGTEKSCAESICTYFLARITIDSIFLIEAAAS